MPSFQDLEDVIGALEGYVAAQIPIITGSLQRLTDDLRRFGPPQLPEIPSLPLFASIPPPPPPPPPAPIESVGSLTNLWGARKPVVFGVGVVGLGLVAGGGWMYWRSIHAAQTKPKAKLGKEVVVVLGVDTPIGHLLVSELRANNCIVIASVSTPEAISEIERIGKGYVKALILDPTDPSSTTPFLRSLQSTLSLKFPIASGDPYAPAAPSDLPTLVSLISLLSLATPDPSIPSTLGHLESTASVTSAASSEAPSATNVSTISISKEYLPHLVATHLTPFSIIQSILPLFRTSKKKGLKHPSIVVALRGGPGSVGLVGQEAATAMSNAAMAKGCEILRREIALTPEVSGTRVVVIDVGELAVRPRASKSPRRPTDPHRFTESVLRIVCGHRPLEASYKYALAGHLSWATMSLRDWWLGDRFSVGAGAGTYSIARHLPLWILDTAILLPGRLLAYRDWLRHKTHSLHNEVSKERRKRKEREREKHAQQELEAAEGKAMVVVHRLSKAASVAAASESSAGQEAAEESVASDVPDSASEPDSDAGSIAVSSGAPSETGGAIGESWVMDVDGEGTTHEAEATVHA